MLAEIHRLFWAQRNELPASGKRALAQTTCCLKATGTAALQKGQWMGAWEYSYLPPIGESEAGIDLNERASVGRFLRERAAIDKILKDDKAKKSAVVE